MKLTEDIFEPIINTADNTLDCFDKIDEFDTSSVNSCNHKVNLFVLGNNKFSFDYEGLKRLIENNLAEYVFSRRKVSQDRLKGLQPGAALEARKQLVKISDNASDLQNFGAGGELGDILLFVFLEGFLKARKMLSKAAIKTNTNDFAKGFDGVHFYRKKYDKYTAYQFVFGEAKIKKDLNEAIEDAFDSLATSYKNKTTELNLLDGTLLNEIVGTDEVMAEVFKTQFIPKYQNAKLKPETEEAFAIFIGYTFEHPIGDGTPPKQLICEKAKRDIASVKNKIIKLITKDKYTANSDFYIYFLPFDDAVNDKKRIMQDIAGITVKLEKPKRK